MSPAYMQSETSQATACAQARMRGIVRGDKAGQGHGTVDYDNVPNCTYCHPEVASVGLTEEQAKAAGHDMVGKFPLVGIGRAVASGHSKDLKIIRDTQYPEILGAHIVGPHATELIAEFVVGRHLEATVEEMEKAMHPHPTRGCIRGCTSGTGSSYPYLNSMLEETKSRMGKDK